MAYCITLRDAEGKAVGIARLSGPKPPLCPTCRNQYVSKLCDFPLGHKKTCSRGMCDLCATSKGSDLDYCPSHKDMTPPQYELFG